MTATHVSAIVALVSCCASVLPTSLRWLRVGQREHYLPSATRFAWRWATSSRTNAFAPLVALACVIAGAFAPAALIATAIVMAVTPARLGVRGRTSKLVWTRRLRTVAGALWIVAAIEIVVSALLGGVWGAAVGAGVAVVTVPFLLDVVLWVLAPIERRLSQRFVDEARAKVARVRPRIVAITGSYGKTTTKNYVAHLIADRFDVVASPRSFNNRAGLARTVNDLLTPSTEVLVAEMGTYGPGEIASMCSWLPPTVAMITAIGPVHLERFKSLDVTLSSKSEITVGAEVTVLNVDDPRLAGLADRLQSSGAKVLRCSAVASADSALAADSAPAGSAPAGSATADSAPADVAVVAEAGTLVLTLSGVRQGSVEVPPGAMPSALSNVACAAAAAIALGSEPAEILPRLASLPTTANRLTVTTAPSGVVVLDDTFNSNPAGAAIALRLLAEHATEGHRAVLVTPGMVELGPLQRQENAKFAEAAACIATDVLVVGRTNAAALCAGVDAAVASGETCNLIRAKSRDDAVGLLRTALGPGDVVLYENDLPDHFP